MEGISNVHKLTKQMPRLQKLLLVFALSLAAKGCGASGTLTLSTEGALAAFNTIQNSTQAPCEMQRQVAAHNSTYDTLKTKKEVIYKAPCDVDKLKVKPLKLGRL